MPLHENTGRLSHSQLVMALNIHPHIAPLVPYVPGKPIDELERELGIPHAIKLASNENPLGPSPKALMALPRLDLPCIAIRTEAGHAFGPPWRMDIN